MGWFILVPVVAVALLLLYVPGAAVLAAMRTPLFPLVALSPAVSMGIFATSAVVADLMGHGWSIWFVIAMTALWVLVALVSVPVSAAIRRRPRPKLSVNGYREILQYLIGIAIIMAVFARPITSALWAPETFSQSYDNALHLNAAHWVGAHGGGSILAYGELNLLWYPPGWHQWTGLTVQVLGTSIPYAFHACMLSLLGVWSLGMSWLVETLLPMRPWSRIIAGSLMLSSISFPVRFMHWGTLYPNYMAFCLLPPLIAAGWYLFRFAKQRSWTMPGVVWSFILAALGIGVTQPNGVFMAVAIMLPLVAARALLHVSDGTRSKHRFGWLHFLVAVGLLAAIAVFVYIWIEVVPSYQAVWEPTQSIPGAVGEVIFGTALGNPVNWLFGIGTVTGTTALIVGRRPRHYLMLAAWAVAIWLFLVAAAFPDGPFRDIATQVFYQDTYRLAAGVTMLGLPVSIYGWMFIANHLYRAVQSYPRIYDRLGRVPVALLAGILGLLLAIGNVVSPAFKTELRSIQDHYTLDDGSKLLTLDELELLRRVPDYVGEDERILVNPGQGGGLAYAVADREVTQYYYSQAFEAPVAYLNQHLNEIDENPKVCEAVQEADVRYVLDLEPHRIDAHNSDSHVGLENLIWTEKISLVAFEGEAALFEINGCDGS